jgi:ACS family glucarate transporter-like MFS transporter
VPHLVPGSVTGTASGFANAIWQLGSVCVPVVVGAVYAATGSFNAAFLTLAAGPLVGLLFMLGVRESRTPGGPAATPTSDTEPELEVEARPSDRN